MSLKISLGILAVLALCLVCCDASATEKRDMRRADYGLWYTVAPQKLSPDGAWVSYRKAHGMHNPEATTLHIKSTTGDAEYSLTRSWGGVGKFSADSKWFAYVVHGGSVALVDLENGATREFSPARKFDFSNDGSTFVVQMDKDAEETAPGAPLRIIDLVNQDDVTIQGVQQYALDRQGRQLAYIGIRDGRSHVGVLRLDDATLVSKVASSVASYSALTWSESGTSLVFLEQVEESGRKGNIIRFHDAAGDQLGTYGFDPREHSDFPEDMKIIGAGLEIVKGSHAVIFNAEPRESSHRSTSSPKTSSTSVQVWHYQDNPTFLEKEKAKWRRKVAMSSYAWWPETNRLVPVATGDLRLVRSVGDGKYALAIDASPYKPLFEFDAMFVTDLYVVDLFTGDKELILKKQALGQARDSTLVSISPTGRYISYYKQRSWWVYDIRSGSHADVGAAIGKPIDGTESSYQNRLAFRPHGSPGWTKADERMIVYDKYDIWTVTADGRSAKRLTNGRDDKNVFRLRSDLSLDFVKGCVPCVFIASTNSFNLADDVVLEVFGEKTKKSGYAVRHPEGAVTFLTFADERVSSLLEAKESDVLVYLRERFDRPPELVLMDQNSGASSVILSTNPHHADFNWGAAELINFTTDDGVALQGVLYVPANYQPDKQYPMIVQVYEDQSNGIHKFIKPSDDRYNGSGINIPRFAADGYFVLLPDIDYKVDRVGFSAVESVTSAVDEVMSRFSIDPDAIGLIGHSFGGYETLFIISQTNMFAAAIAGAPPVDLASAYLGTFPLTGGPIYDNFEKIQFRFSGPMHEMYDVYKINSPVYHASGINTPLLSWFGDEDSQVEWTQGILLYHLMKRMQKEHVFLVYPGEGHMLSNAENQEDLDSRVLDWFGHYLKGQEPAKWMVGDGHQ